MDWIAIVTPAAASLLTLLLTNLHSRSVARAQHESAEQRLKIELAERRYDDRRDAVIAFDLAAEKEADAIENFESRHGTTPSDFYEGYRFNDLWSAYARVAVLATPTVAEAAERIRNAIVGAFHGADDRWPIYHTALSDYRAKSQAMLAGDPWRNGTAERSAPSKSPN